MPTVLDALARHARERPDAVAHRDQAGGWLSYGRWDRRADLIARHLATRLPAGSPVILWVDNARVLDYVVMCAAVQKAGGVPVPVHASRTPGQVAEIATAVGAATIAALCDASTPPGLDPLPTPEEMTRDTGHPDPPAARLPDTALILHTSGTAGSPKAVLVPHGNLLSGLRPHRPGDGGPVLHAFTLGTSAAETVLVRSLAPGGRTVVTMNGFDVRTFVGLVHLHGVTAALLTPPTATAVANSRIPDARTAGSLRSIRVGAAATPLVVLERLKDRLPWAEVSNIYTTTEAWPAATLLRHGAGGAQSGETVGRPVRGTRVRVVDDAGDPLPTGAVGRVELCCPGTVRRRYLTGGGATGAERTGAGWVATGDLGRLDTAGLLHLYGRVDDVVNTGGVKVSLIDVEGRLAQHPAVESAAAFGSAHPTLGEYLCAAVVTRCPVTPVELRAFVAQGLGPGAAPRAILVVDALPTNEGGKVSTAQLRALLEQSAVPLYEEPRDELEAAIRAILQQVTGAAALGVNDEFLAAGGDSVAAAEAAALIQDRFGVGIAGDELETSTVRGLAQRVAAVQRHLRAVT